MGAWVNVQCLLGGGGAVEEASSSIGMGLHYVL